MLFREELLDIIDYAYSQAHDSEICVCPSAVPEWDDRKITDDMYNKQLRKLDLIRAYVYCSSGHGQLGPRFTQDAIETLTEEIDRRVEDWLDVVKGEYGDKVPDNDPNFDALNERIHLLLMLEANLSTVQLIEEYALCEEQIRR